MGAVIRFLLNIMSWTITIENDPELDNWIVADMDPNIRINATALKVRTTVLVGTSRGTSSVIRRSAGTSTVCVIIMR